MLALEKTRLQRFAAGQAAKNLVRGCCSRVLQAHRRDAIFLRDRVLKKHREGHAGVPRGGYGCNDVLNVGAIETRAHHRPRSFTLRCFAFLGAGAG